MDTSIIGGLIFAVPAALMAWLALWRRARPVFWSALAMIVVATGYLVATGAARDIATSTLGVLAPAGAPAR